ncbi:MAG: hypothetical protein LBQ48_03325 [Oscillospiraceae bacterium]|jgi:hypothetical protein|nr:hypothetical protein [Oscillospiraceae bacterium]
MKLTKKNLRAELAKYATVFLLAGHIILTGCNSGGEGSDSSAAGTPSAERVSGAGQTEMGTFGKGDLRLEIAGVEVVLMTDSASLIAALGNGYEMAENISCHFAGSMDRDFFYPTSENEEILVSTYGLEGRYVIGEIRFGSDKYKTKKGITAGSSVQEVIDAYGENYTVDEGGEEEDGVLKTGIMHYWLGEKENEKTPRLYFDVENGKVTNVNVYSAAQDKFGF